MEILGRDNRREQLSKPGAASHFDQRILILYQNQSPCLTGQCGTFLKSLQSSFDLDQIQVQSSSFLSESTRFEPDLVLLLLPTIEAARPLIESCKQRWSAARIFALFCPASDQPVGVLEPLLDCVDEFLACPVREAELVLRVRRLLQSKKYTIATLGEAIKKQLQQACLVGESPSFLRVVEKIPFLAHSDATVLIDGETGSGKEVIARAIHYQGSRQGKPFVPVNCGALPDILFENELFGHAKGAFTDASSVEKGLIGEAQGGTLFLDEIDTLSDSGQVKLLRFLQNGEYRPLGSSRPIIGDVRVIAATNADLMERIRSKQFREDLYYRLNLLSLSVPPLRQRMGDIVLLASYFLARYAREHGEVSRQLSQGAIQKLMAHSWPGNVRELESVIHRALVLTSSQTIEGTDIDVPLPERDAPSQSESLKQAKLNSIQAFERDYLKNLLASHRGNVTHAAKAAGKDRRAFQRLLRKYALDRHSYQN